MIEFAKRQAAKTIEVFFICGSLWFLIKILGYEPNTITLGAAFGVMTVYLGQIVDAVVNR